MESHKVFGIGFQKTGTTTLHVALNELGYKVKGTDEYLIQCAIENQIEPILQQVASYDAFEDHPWPNLYKELDSRYPGSKFILTVRDENTWIASCQKYFKNSSLSQKWLYGEEDPVRNPEGYLKVYRDHNVEAIAYFANRKSDFLLLDWEKGDGWKELCEFLGKATPKKPFPHANRQDDPGRWYKDSKIVAKLLIWFPWIRQIKRFIIPR